MKKTQEICLTLLIVMLFFVVPFTTREVMGRNEEDSAEPLQVNSWSSAEMINAGSEEMNYTSPILSVDNSGVVHAIWSAYSVDNISKIEHRTFVNGHWSEIEPLVQKTNCTLYPTIMSFDTTIDTLGRLHIVWASEGFHHRYLLDQTWSAPYNISGEPFYFAIGADLQGKVHLVWHGYEGGTAKNLFYRCFDGTTWSEKSQITNFGSEDGSPSGSIALTVSSDGRIFVLYHYGYWGGEEPPIDQLLYSYYDGQSWTTQLFADCYSRGFDAAFDASGKLHVAYVDLAASTILNYRTMVDGEWSATEAIVTFTPSGDPEERFYGSIVRPDMFVIGSDIFIAFTVTEWLGGNYTDYAYEYDLFLKHFDGSSWKPEICLVADDDYWSFEPSITADTSGTVFVAWINYPVTDPPYSSSAVYFMCGFGEFSYKPTKSSPSFLFLSALLAIPVLTILVRRKEK